MLRSLSVAIALSLLAIPAADAKPDYKGLSPNARATLQSFHAYMKDCDPDKSPLASGNDTVASQALSTCERVIKNQRKRLDRIKGADRKHPTFKKFSAYQARLEKLYPQWVAQRKAAREKAGELRQRAIKMKKDLRKHSSTLWFLKDAASGKPRLGESNTYPGAAKKHWDAVAAIETLAGDCKGTYAAVLADKELSRWALADRTPKPKEACELAARGQALLSEWLPKAVSAFAETKRKQYQGFVDDVTKNGKASDHILEILTAEAMKKRIDEVVAGYQPTATVLGVTVAAESFAAWNEVAAKMPAAIKAASKVKRPRQKASNGKVTSAIKKSLKGSPLRFKKLGLYSKQGKIVKNGVGIPLRKAWSGDLLVKKKGESFCRLYDASVVASYKGGGRYQKPVSRGLPRVFNIAACK